MRDTISCVAESVRLGTEQHTVTSTKFCTTCDTEKPLSEFNRKGDAYQSKCRLCQREWYAEYYKNNPKEKARLIANRADERERNRLFIRQAKSVPCMDCKKSFPYYVMDFDHRDPEVKDFNVGPMVAVLSLEKIKKEVAKCDVVCANCHRERTFGPIPG